MTKEMSDSNFKNLCKKTWVLIRNSIRKGMELDIRVIKALKYSIIRR